MRYVFLDLDNTLTDRKATVSAYAEYFLAEFSDSLNLDVSAEYLKGVFNDFDRGGYESHEVRSKLIAELGIWKTPQPSNELSNHWQKWVPNNSLPMAGLHQCLGELIDMGFKLCLVSNGQSKNQRDKIKKLSLEPYFERIVISEEVGFKKPDRRIFQIAQEEMGSNSCEAFFVGDHPINDCMASIEVGFLAIWLEGAHTWPVNIPKPYSIKNLNELCPLVRNLAIKGKGREKQRATAVSVML